MTHSEHKFHPHFSRLIVHNDSFYGDPVNVHNYCLIRLLVLEKSYMRMRVRSQNVPLAFPSWTMVAVRERAGESTSFAGPVRGCVVKAAAIANREEKTKSFMVFVYLFIFFVLRERWVSQQVQPPRSDENHMSIQNSSNIRTPPSNVLWLLVVGAQLVRHSSSKFGSRVEFNRD